MGQPGVLPSEINIVTLNCWGLKLNISKQRQARLAEIGAQLANTHPPPNIVCLQEIWAHDDYLAGEFIYIVKIIIKYSLTDTVATSSPPPAAHPFAPW